MYGRSYPSVSPSCSALAFALVLAMILLAAHPALAQYSPPSGNNNWLLSVHYFGTATLSSTDPDESSSNVRVNGAPVPSGGLDLSTIANTPASTTTGGITAQLGGSMGSESPWVTRHLTANATVTITLTWQPKNNDAANNPAPEKLVVFYRGCAAASASASNGSNASGSGTAQGTTQSASAPGGNGSPPVKAGAWQSLTLTPANGTAQTQFNFNLDISTTTDPYPASGGATCYLDFAVGGHSNARFAHQGNTLHDGDNDTESQDPTYTRWLPLSFSPTVRSQQFRLKAGALPAPWGNVSCIYTMHVGVEPASANLDMDAAGLVLLPSGSPGDFNSPSPPYLPAMNTLGSFPQTVFTDCNGDRLVYGSPEILSTVTENGNGSWTIANAGPPGAMRYPGIYTYQFEATTGSGTAGRLLSISDAFGNQQTLSWSPSSLVVTDATSGRQLQFTGPANGYFTTVTAPGNPGTTTNLTYDGGGHLTNLSVYLTGGMTPVRTATYTYGDGSNPDAIPSRSEGGISSSFGYVADTTAADPFGVAAPRLTSESCQTPCRNEPFRAV